MTAIFLGMLLFWSGLSPFYDSEESTRLVVLFSHYAEHYSESSQGFGDYIAEHYGPMNTADPHNPAHQNLPFKQVKSFSKVHCVEPVGLPVILFVNPAPVSYSSRVYDPVLDLVPADIWQPPQA